MTHVLDARIGCGVLACDRLGLIARRVVHQDKAEITIGLRKERIERLAQVLRAVEQRRPNADLGSCCRCLAARSRRSDRGCVGNPARSGEVHVGKVLLAGEALLQRDVGA